LLASIAAGGCAAKTRGAAGRSGAAHRSAVRGRPIGSGRGALRGGARLDLLATLRAAAPWQALRRRESPSHRPGFLVRGDDFHVRRFREQRESTTVFAVDASGSQALHRLGETKGAVELLLADCYVRRDRVAVIAFRGQQAQLLLAPTRSLVHARRSLAGLPGGGGTPLASGLAAARELATRILRDGGTPLLVLLTDGSANVALDGTGGRERAFSDALATARAWATLGARSVVIDTSPRPHEQARAVAQAMAARYLALPGADAHRLARSIAA
jgi:magnesium chelatase subunit D